jgi:membrane-associated phospholipid phosphatase
LLIVSAGSLLIVPAFVLIASLWLVGLLLFLIRRVMLDVGRPFALASLRLGRIGWDALAVDPLGRRLHELASRPGRIGRWTVATGTWIEARARFSATGIWRTVLVSATLAVAVTLMRLGRLVAQPEGWVVQVDERLADLIGRLGQPSERSVMLGLTAAGRTQVIVIAVIILLVGSIAAGARRSAALILAITAGSAGLVTLLKAAIGRTRPAIGLLAETSSSWPSGHASAGLALTLAIVVAWWAAGRPHWPWLAAAILPFGVLIGYSRIYLAVHWTSDVVGGWLVGSLGTLGVLLADNALGRPGPPPRPPGAARALPISVALVALLMLGTGYARRSEVLPSIPELTPTVLASRDPAEVLATIEPFSESLTGQALEPVSVVVAASESTLRAAVEAAGWSVADDPSARRLLSVYWAGLRSHEDPQAPVTPTFLDARMQDLAIEKPVNAAAPSVRERHHARWWRLGVSTGDGCPIWVGTASLDERVEWTWRTILPNHHIAPAIDAERDLLVSDLSATGLFDALGRRRVTEPMLGTNAAGDPWFTDGLAEVMATTQPCEG